MACILLVACKEEIKNIAVMHVMALFLGGEESNFALGICLILFSAGT